MCCVWNAGIIISCVTDWSKICTDGVDARPAVYCGYGGYYQFVWLAHGLNPGFMCCTSILYVKCLGVWYLNLYWSTETYGDITTITSQWSAVYSLDWRWHWHFITLFKFIETQLDLTYHTVILLLWRSLNVVIPPPPMTLVQTHTHVNHPTYNYNHSK